MVVGSFQILALVNCAAMNIRVQRVFLHYVFKSLGTLFLGTLDSAFVSTGVKEPVELVRKEARPRETELNRCPEPAKAKQEDEAQERHLVNLWLLFSYMMDTLLFRLYLIFLVTSIITVIVLWNT